MKSKPLIFLILLLSGVAIAFLTIKPKQSLRITAIGSAPSDFKLVDINNNTLTLSDMKGSVIYINFWATWCESCIEEIPSIERLFRLLSGNSKFKIVTILYKDDKYRASSYMKENGYTFPVYLNPEESAAGIFGITGIPETFIIDKKGILRNKVIGPADWDSPRVIESFQTLINEP